MSIKWTPTQEKAIYDKGGSLLVSAAAGSGKTAVLVERAVQLIIREQDPVPADRLLIVTFTNAAAQELRSRIANRVEEEVQCRPSDINLRKQRILLHRASICTIDAFCIQLVKENFGRLKLPPDITVADEALVHQIAEMVLEEVVEEMYNDPAFAQFAAMYGRARSDASASSAIKELYDFTRTLPFPEKALNTYAQMYRGDVAMCDTLWAKELLKYAGSAVRAAITNTEAALVCCAENGLEGYMASFQRDMQFLLELLQNVCECRWDSSLLYLQSYEFGAIGRLKGGDDVYKERVKELRSKTKKTCEDLLKYCFVCTEKEYEQDLAQTLPVVEALCKGAKMYAENFLQAKLLERVLDFSDFEQMTLNLLVNQDGERTTLANNICRRYDAVMVDEYQDTNELQDAIYRTLANQQGSNLFYVGDVKQSIYRFRKANPGIFMQKKVSWHSHGSGQHPAVLTLGHNFRSDEGIINGVNYFFENLMSDYLGEIFYNEDEKLIRGGEEGETSGFEIRIIDDPDAKGDAAYVAQRIYNMYKGKVLVRDNGVRACDYGDFCILLRSRKNMQSYVAQLEALEVPVVCDASENLLQAPEILPLIAVLGCIDNPGDDVSVAAALLGPLFRLTPDELAELRKNSGKGRLWGALVVSENETAAEFVKSINFYRTFATEVSVGRLCEELAQRTGYFSAVSAMEGGSARRENLQKFLGWAASLSSGGRGGLSGFMRFLRAGNGPSEQGGKVVPGHVNILTIHKSKGLEFPFCFLADTTGKFNRTDLNSKFQLHSELGVGIALRQEDLIYPTLPLRAIRQRSDNEANSEDMRVLYVALTRPKQKMIITIAEKDPGKLLNKMASAVMDGMPDAFQLSQYRRFSDWILLAALCNPGAEPVMKYTGGLFPKQCAGAAGNISVEVVDQLGIDEAIEKEYRLTALPDEVAAGEIAKNFVRENENFALQGLPVKLSVTELTKPQSGQMLGRPSFMYTAGLTAAEKGTAQHEFMQYANFAVSMVDLESEIKRLVDFAFMRADIAEKLDKGSIKSFLSSSLAQRFAKADKVYREQDFITAINAIEFKKNLPQKFAEEKILVQGVADALLVFSDHVELVDYKTDRRKSAEKLIETYSGQLNMYEKALRKRFKLPISKLTIWSFHLETEIDVPIE